MTRLELIKALSALAPNDFNVVAIEVGIPDSNLPPPTATPGERAYALLQWADSYIGCGLPAVEAALENLRPAEPSPPDPALTESHLSSADSDSWPQDVSPISTLAPSSATPGDCPFVAGPMITNPQCFVGRKEALQTLTSLMSNTQPTSVNVVGDRRIGKSSLLYHFFQTWQQRVPPHQNQHFAVIYLSLQAAPCRQESSFYQAVAAQLRNYSGLAQHPTWRQLWGQEHFDRVSFAAAVRQAKAAGILPVLCLDEFECLFSQPDSFDDGFFDSLRDLMNTSVLMLITASRRLLDHYRSEQKLTSSFFNLGQSIPLGAFSEVEAQTLVALPDPAHPALPPNLQALALQWGGRHPLLLQLAAQKLWQAHTYGNPIPTAKQAFQQEARRLYREQRSPHNWPRPLHWLVFRLPGYVGQALGQGFNGLERVLKLGPVPLLFILAVLVAMGIITQPHLAQLGAILQDLREALGLP